MKKIIAILILAKISIGLAQDGKIKRADENFENFAFMDAIASYEGLTKKGLNDEDIFKKLGNANYMNAKYDEAATWYGKLVQLENTSLEPNYLYRYAQSLKSLGKYEESDLWMNKFQLAKSSDLRAGIFNKNQKYLEKIESNSGRYTVKNLSLNSNVSDFSPSFYGEKNIVFSTARDSGIVTKKIHQWNKGAFLNLYNATFDSEGNTSEIRTFSKSLNTKTHESSAVFTKDKKTIYFTRNNSKNGSFSRDSQKVSRLKIYRGQLIDEKWVDIEELPFNSDEYSIAHPALSKDEKTLYFSSDMPGTNGLSDIFKVAINEDGSFGTPQNLGKTINTEARETFPFIHEDILYFSSDGHPGLGGLDVFAVKHQDLNSEILNVGEPVNSTEDDFSFIINGKSLGYFASNREGGKGGDDIYSLIENEPLTFRCYDDITGVIVDSENNETISNATFEIISSDGSIIQEGVSDVDGKFTLQLDCNEGNYTFNGNKETFEKGTASLLVTGGESKEVTVPLHKIPEILLAPVGQDLIKHLALNPINFDLDKSNIRPDAQEILNKVVEYLTKYQDAKISIDSHTDVKASYSYNKSLSKRRAKSTYNYLIEQGIDAARMMYKGYGETKLVNDCTVWNKCTPSENEKNRRSEIIVVE